MLVIALLSSGLYTCQYQHAHIRLPPSSTDIARMHQCMGMRQHIYEQDISESPQQLTLSSQSMSTKTSRLTRHHMLL